MPKIDVTDEEFYVVGKLRELGPYGTLRVTKQAGRVERVTTERSEKPTYPQENAGAV